MTKKVLIIYGSWLGSTKEIAEAIATSMRAEGASVDVMTGNQVKNVDAYDGVIIDSTVRMGMLNGKMQRPVRKYAKQLKQMPVAGFVGCAVLGDAEQDDPVAMAKGFLTKFTDKLGLSLIDNQPFMGAILAENARGIMKMSVNAMQQDPNYKGDERDWDAIAAWAKDVLAKF
jgi:menaquinone-dependent protoporphyrinogen oxidase